jgi:HNH endonuclease
MSTTLQGEIWKPVIIELGQTKGNKIEVSSHGRIRSFNMSSDGNILIGSMVNGYKIIRLKFFLDRDEATEKNFAYHRKQIEKFNNKIAQMKLEKGNKVAIKEATALLKGLKANLQLKYAEDLKKRTINYHSLTHRLVATYFLKKPNKDQTIVAHLDYEKLNNKASNLKWMTHAENVIHQSKSPYVIADKATRRSGTPLSISRNTKLTVTKVMLLKKLLNEGKDVNKLAKQFKVSGTQIIRIRDGVNWGDVPAGK